jgi:hypothetical protein
LVTALAQWQTSNWLDHGLVALQYSGRVDGLEEFAAAKPIIGGRAL